MNADKRRYLNLENYNQIQLLGNSEQLPPTVKITVCASFAHTAADGKNYNTQFYNYKRQVFNL